MELAALVSLCSRLAPSGGPAFCGAAGLITFQTALSLLCGPAVGSRDVTLHVPRCRHTAPPIHPG